MEKEGGGFDNLSVQGVDEDQPGFVGVAVEVPLQSVHVAKRGEDGEHDYEDAEDDRGRPGLSDDVLDLQGYGHAQAAL